MRIAAIGALLFLSACAAPPQGPLAWAVGEWRGDRIDAATGRRAPMTVAVQEILGGKGTFEQLEVHGEKGSYLGVSTTVFDRTESRWVRQYANNGKGRFVRIEGPVGEADPPHAWDVVSATRRSRLTIERPEPDRWLRIMCIGELGSSTWNELWRDDLIRH